MQKLSLKLKEKLIDESNIWIDDQLDSKSVADSLTKLINGQSNPIVYSLNGSWGCGKTFLLQRWQMDLQNQGYDSIYFNAWEADFCTDPLVAIIGQLWDKLKKSDFKEMVDTIKETAKPLLVKTVFNTLRAFSGGAVDLNSKDLKSESENSIDDYLSQKQLIEVLKNHLSELSNSIFNKTDFPLVFIIDELDRCRPTFSIELLEKIKHLFNVKNIVFVLGIDRKQLGYSINAVYGDIDIEGYLKRFIDIDFSLNNINYDAFCNSLFNLYNINTFFKDKDTKVGNSFHLPELSNFKKSFMDFCEAYDMSLRDIEHAIRTFVLASIKLKDRHYMFPELLSLLIVLKIKENILYKEFISGEILPSQLINELFERLSTIKSRNYADDHHLNLLEAKIYATNYNIYSRSDNIEFKQLKLLSEGNKPDNPKYISERAKNSSKEVIDSILYFYKNLIDDFRGNSINKGVFKYLLDFIEISPINLGNNRY